MILVIGATGHFGRETVEALAAGGHAVRALSRTPETAGLPENVAVVGGDLADADSLRAALDGVTAVFAVLPFGMDASVLLGEVVRADVERIVFLSSGAVVDGAEQQTDVIAEYHAGVERAIAETGIPHTFLRLLFPAINSLSYAMQLSDGYVVRGPYAGATSAPVHEGDVADAAVRVLTADGYEGRTYLLTGPESLTQVELVEILGRCLARPLSFEELDAGPVRRQMAQFLDGDFVKALFDLMAATVGRQAEVTPAIRTLTGREPRSYREWADDHIADFE